MLAELLRKIGRNYFPTKGCNSCEGHVNTMNANGPAWCEANVPAIVGWLATSAKTQRLPFWQRGAAMLVRRAVAIAKSNG